MKLTVVPGVKPLPVIATTVPPAIGPWDGEIDAILGAVVCANAGNPAVVWKDTMQQTTARKWDRFSISTLTSHAGWPYRADKIFKAPDVVLSFPWIALARQYRSYSWHQSFKADFCITTHLRCSINSLHPIY